jgi:hypothetical protein
MMITRLSGQELVPGLFQRERTIAAYLLESGRRCSDPMFQIAEEQLVGTVNALRYVLDRLGTKVVPEAKPLGLFEISYVTLYPHRSDAFLKTPVVPLMQCYKVVIYRASYIYPAAQPLIPFCVIELENIRSHLLFCSSIYFLTVASEICPTDSQ